MDVGAATFTTSPPTTNPGSPGTSNVAWNMHLMAGSQIVDLTPYDIFVLPGEFVTVSGVTDAANSGVACGLNWQEDV